MLHPRALEKPFEVFKEATVLLRPLPPFRAKPSRRAVAPKAPSESRKPATGITVKARRHPVKLARLHSVPSLKVLGRDASPAV